jgi:hypothetical protein
MTTETVKKAIINKALARGNQKLSEIAVANNIGLSTLNRWLRENKFSNSSITAAKVIGLPNGERYKHLKATCGQNDVKIGTYCRKHGLYPHQLKQWETEFMTNSALISKQQPNLEIRALKAEVVELKKSIMRKDKVLAETMALLILKKKATQLWGESEDD